MNHHKLRTTHDTKLFLLSVIGVLLTIALVHCAFAKPVDLGVFGEHNYYYDDSSIEYHDNTRVVWVGTGDPRFNFLHDEGYGGAVGQIAIDCSGHTSALIAGAVFDHEGNILHQRTIPDQDWAFFAIKHNTVQDELYRILCVYRTAS